MSLKFDKENINETEEHFLWRIGQAYDMGLFDGGWNDIADIMNRTFRPDPSTWQGESSYRKSYQQAKRFVAAGVLQTANGASDDVQELIDAKHELFKERQRVFDERAALRRDLRAQARQESLCDIIRRCLDEYDRMDMDFPTHDTSSVKLHDSGNDLIIHLTDVHTGLTMHSPLNDCDIDILEQRFTNYFKEILEIQRTYQAQNAYVILGGDLIHGLIHLNARLESKENIVQQIMTASDLVCQFLYNLSKHFHFVEVYTTPGNHARVMANKAEVGNGENFDLLIPYICRKSLQNVTNVQIYDNTINPYIATFEVRGHVVYAVHGDKDNPKTVVQDMIKFAMKAGYRLPDMIYMGHLHKNGYDTIDNVKVIFTGCMDGMDSYAIDSRLVGVPEQTITVTSEDRRIKALCDVPVDLSKNMQYGERKIEQ